MSVTCATIATPTRSEAHCNGSFRAPGSSGSRYDGSRLALSWRHKEIRAFVDSVKTGRLSMLGPGHAGIGED